MQLVIEIDEELHRTIEQYGIECLNDIEREVLRDLISDGAPLPKGHGRLIDADALLKNNELDKAIKYGNKDVKQRDNSYSTMMLYEIADMIENEPTILEANEE